MLLLVMYSINTDELLRLEYLHAGNDYTEAQVDIFGAGTGEELVADEFRDGAIHRIEIGETVESQVTLVVQITQL